MSFDESFLFLRIDCQQFLLVSLHLLFKVRHNSLVTLHPYGLPYIGSLSYHRTGRKLTGGHDNNSPLEISVKAVLSSLQC